MGTRSYIAYEDASDSMGKIVVSYCHYDGYPSNNGKILLESYNDKNLAYKLAKSGYMSSLNNNFEEIDRHNKEKPYEYNNLYCLMHSLGNDIHIEYIYLWQKGAWYISEMKMIASDLNRATKSKLPKDSFENYLAYHTKFKKLEPSMCVEK